MQKRKQKLPARTFAVFLFCCAIFACSPGSGLKCAVKGQSETCTNKKNLRTGPSTSSTDGEETATTVAAEDEMIQGASASFPFVPGDAAATADVKLSEGLPIATGALLSLGQGGDFRNLPVLTPLGRSVLVASSSLDDPLSNFAMTLPLPAPLPSVAQAALGTSNGGYDDALGSTIGRVVVVALTRTTHEGKGFTTYQIISGEALRVGDEAVTFTAQHFGTYQLAISDLPVVSETVAVPFDIVPIAQRDSESLPPVEANMKGQVTSTGGEETLTFWASGNSYDKVARCVLRVSDTDGPPWDYAQALDQKIFYQMGEADLDPDVAGTAGYKARCECLDRFGRAFTTDWSTAVNFPPR